MGEDRGDLFWNVAKPECAAPLTLTCKQGKADLQYCKQRLVIASLSDVSTLANA